MNKLYLILTTSFLSFNSTYSLLSHDNQLQKDEEAQVFHILEQFLQPTKPLKISYLGSEHETLSASTIIVTQAIKKVLKQIDPVFTDQCLSKISLGNSKMIPGKAVKVSLFYRLDKQKSFYTGMDIYVKEHDSSKTQKVINALKIFNSPATAVKVDHRYAGKYADEYGGYNQAGSAIRFKIQVRFKTLLPHLMVSPKSITFNHVQLKPGSLVSLIASYRGKSTAILVKLTG